MRTIGVRAVDMAAMETAPTMVDAAEHPYPEDAIDAVKGLMLRLAAGERFERLGAIVQEHLQTTARTFRAQLALDALVALTHSIGGAAPR